MKAVPHIPSKTNVGRRVRSTHNFTSGDEPGFHVPVGSTGRTTGVCKSGYHIAWDEPAKWSNPDAMWSTPDAGTWEFIQEILCAECDGEAGEDDYLCKACRCL